MEESSEAHMETDVSSTTDDAIDTQEVTGSNGQVEMTITVEKVDEEEATSNMEVDTQLEALHHIPSPSKLEEKLHKDPQSPSVDSKSPNKSNEVSEAIRKSPTKTETPQKLTVTRIISPSQFIVQTPSADKSESADSSTKIDSLSSKDTSLPLEKTSNNIVNSAVTIKLVETIKKSPVKEINVQRSPAKHVEGQKALQLCEADSKSPKGRAERNPLKKPEQKLCQVIIKSPSKTSSPVKLVRRLPRELIMNNTTLEIKSQDSTKSTSLGKPIASDKNDLITTKPSQNETKVPECTDNVSKCSEVSKNAEALKSTEVLKRTEVSKESEVLKSTEVSKEPEVFKSSDVSKSTEVSNSSDISKSSDVSKSTNVSKSSDFSNSTEVSKSSDVSKSTEVSKSSEVSKSTDDSKKSEVIVNNKVSMSAGVAKSTELPKITHNPKSHNHMPIEVPSMEAEASNDSQLSSTASEKEHNKSISRELKSLINSAKESKIISECTQLTSKTRKSRTHLDTSLNMSEVETPNEKKDVQVSESSDKTKRSMRSQNPDFVTKCKQFLNSVTSKVMKDSDLETMSEDEVDNSKQKQKTPTKTSQVDSSESAPKRKKIEHAAGLRSSKFRADPYCWKCHWALEEEGDEKTTVLPSMHCTVCVRSYHTKCLSIAERKISPDKNWVCPDCILILNAESSRSPAMKKISLGMLCDLLKFALERMMALNGMEAFLQPVNRTEFPDYDKVVVHPMDLSLMKKNIADGLYGSTEAFIADAQWILHNSILFNASHSKLTAAARALVRTCRAEMGEIETCPECYAGAHSRKLTFFTDVCSTPHMLLWAKLKGFPYWPAKAMAVNPSKEGMVVDVRFFGDHDRAWLNVKDCFLYSEKDPNTVKNKKQELLLSRQEAEVHIRNICRKYGSFVYAPFRIPFDPTKMNEQLKLMIPSFEGELKVCKEPSKPSPVSKDTRRSTSKSSKSSFNDGDTSECEDTSSKTKVTVHAEMPEDAAPEENKEKPETDTESNNKNNTMDIVISQVTETPQKVEKTSRKRRRSKIPSSETSETAPKKKKLEEKLEEKKTQEKKAEEKKTQEIKPDEKKTQEKKEEKRQEKKPEETSKEYKREIIKNHEQEVAELTEMETDEKSMDEIQKSPKLLEEREALRVTPIKLVALPRANKQTPKLFTTAKVTKTPSQSSASTPSTPTASSTDTTSDDSTKEKRNRSKVTKADRDIMSNDKLRTNRRTSKNKLFSTTPKQEKTDKTDKKADGKTDSGNDDSTSKEKPKKKDESDRSLLKKADNPKAVKDEKDKDKKSKKSVEDISLSVVARETRHSSSGLPTISNVCSLSTTSQNTSTTNTKVTITPKSTSTKTSVYTHVPKSVEITVEAKPHSSIFTPTSMNNVGNMNEAVTKLQKIRNDTDQPFVGRVGVKAFARMTSPDINDSVQVEIKPEPIDLDEIDEERQMEKMDLMNACKLQPVNQQSLRDVRINKVVVTPSVVVKKKPEPRARAKKTFPQPRRPEDGRSELNGKNSMVYIPIQPPMTQAPMRSVRPGAPAHGINMPANVTAGPRMTAPVTSTNNTVNTVLSTGAGAIRPLNANLSSPPALAPTSSSGSLVTVPTVGPTAVHTVPLMTSVNGQWMFSLQPVMSVGGLNTSPSPPMVNGINERPAATLVPISTSSAAPVITPVPNRTVNANQAKDNGTPGELPRLQQRPLMNPLDPENPVGSVPIPSTAGPITAKLNQNAVKLTDFFRTLLEDTIEKLDEPVAQVSILKLQLEQARWRYQQTIDELKHNHELTVSELRTAFEKEKLRIISDTRRTAQDEVAAAVKLTKMKQWCANCFQEAQFYCCWNTSYCDHACQRAHWSVHHTKCTQERAFHQPHMEQNSNRCDEDVLTAHQMTLDGRRMLTLMLNPTQRDDNRQNQRQDACIKDNDTPESRLKQADNPPKSVPSQTPTLTVGGKLAPARVFTDASGTQKTSIIVSMVEDGSGNQTLKCLGTYKAPTQTSPLLINKQKSNDDSGAAAKKVVTSGGYLIVGSDNTTSVITPASASRRPQIYYT